MKKKIVVLIIMLGIFFINAQNAIVNGKREGLFQNEPLLTNFYRMYETLPIGGDSYHIELDLYGEATAATNHTEWLATVKKMIEEMDIYFEKKKNSPNYDAAQLSSIGNDLMNFYSTLSPDNAYKEFKGYHVEERDNYNLSAPEYQKYGRIINKWRMKFRINHISGQKPKNEDEAIKWVQMWQYLYTGIPRRIKDSENIVKNFFDNKNFNGIEDYFFCNGKVGRGDYSLTNFYQNYKVPKELYTVPYSKNKQEGYVKVYLGKLQSYYNNQLKVKKSKVSALKRLFTTFPEEKILEDIEEEREKYQEWKKENSK